MKTTKEKRAILQHAYSKEGEDKAVLDLIEDVDMLETTGSLIVEALKERPCEFEPGPSYLLGDINVTRDCGDEFCDRCQALAAWEALMTSSLPQGSTNLPL